MEKNKTGQTDYFGDRPLSNRIIRKTNRRVNRRNSQVSRNYKRKWTINQPTLFLSVFLLLCIGFPFITLAAPLTNQNFDSVSGAGTCDSTPVSGIADWTGAHASLVNTTYVSPSTSLQLSCSGYSGNATYAPTTLGSTSEISYWFKVTYAGPSGYPFEATLLDSTGCKFGDVQYGSAVANRLDLNGTGVASGLSTGTSYFVDEQFDYIGHRARLALNGGSWSSWITGSSCSNIPNRFYVQATSIAYFDSLSFAPVGNLYSDTIDTPAQLGYSDIPPTGADYVFSGHCSSVGKNYALTLSNSVVPSNLNIVCNSDGTWSGGYKIVAGEQTVYLYDSVLHNFVSVSFYGQYYVNATDWNVGSVYPVISQGNTANADVSSSYPMLGNYTVPPDSNMLLTSVRVEECTTASCTTLVTPGGLVFLGNIASLGTNSDATGNFNFTYNMTAGTHYLLYQVLDGSTTPSTVMYQVLDTITGVTVGTGQTSTPSWYTGSVGGTCTLTDLLNCFVPTSSQYQAVSDQITTALNARIVGLSDVMSAFLNDFAGISGNNFITPTISIFGSAPVNIMPTNFLGSVSDPTSPITLVRTILSFLLYIHLCYFIIKLIPKLVE